MINWNLSYLKEISTDADVIKMLDCLSDNIFVQFGGRIFQQTIGILWVLIVLHYLPTCFYTRVRRILYRVVLKQVQNALPNNSISHTDT